MKNKKYLYHNYMKKKILIVGLGWGSAGFLKSIDNNKYSIELYSIDDFLYTPLLAQNIKHNKNLLLTAKQINKHVNYFREEIINVKFDENIVQTINSKIVDYDYLILCHGSDVNTFNIQGVYENCQFVKNNTDVNIIKNTLSKLPTNSNIVVIGCGLTGSEIVGTLIDYNKFNIHAIDAFDRPLVSFDRKLSNYTINFWKKYNVHMYLDHKVTNINKKHIKFNNSNQINYDLAIWCGGIKKSSLTETVLETLQKQNKKGIPVNSQLLVENCNNVYAIGDCADANQLPTAQVAFQQGKYLATLFNNDFKYKNQFHFKNKGQICYIGKNKSVCDLPYFKGGGNLVYYLNRVIHIYNGITYKQKLDIF